MTLQDVNAIVNDIITFPGSTADLRQACQRFLDADGVHKKEATLALLQAAKGNIRTVDSLIDLVTSTAGITIFGADVAKQIHEHALAIQAAGAKYCDCQGCTGCAKLIDAEADVLAAV